jgi:hypothetical protein
MTFKNYQDYIARNHAKPKIRIRRIGYCGWEVTIPPYAGLQGDRAVYANFETANRYAHMIISMRSDLIEMRAR